MHHPKKNHTSLSASSTIKAPGTVCAVNSVAAAATKPTLVRSGRRLAQRTMMDNPKRAKRTKQTSTQLPSKRQELPRNIKYTSQSRRHPRHGPIAVLSLARAKPKPLHLHGKSTTPTNAASATPNSASTQLWGNTLNEQDTRRLTRKDPALAYLSHGPAKHSVSGPDLVASRLPAFR